MELSIFVAKLIGALYIAVGLGLILDKAYYQKAMTKMLDEAGIMYLGGAMALVTGILLVSYHNIWVKDWEVIITILGWASLIKGIGLLVFPSATIGFYKPMLKGRLVANAGVFALVLGLILGYYGYIA